MVAETNASGAAVQINTYDEYGMPGSGNTSRFGYTGQMWIAEIGLYHYRNRVYNPTIGRFMQTDPIGQRGGINLYAYVGNDPVNYTDPWGLKKGRGTCYHFTAHDHLTGVTTDQGVRCNPSADTTELLNWMSGQPAYFAGGAGGMGIGGRSGGPGDGRGLPILGCPEVVIEFSRGIGVGGKLNIFGVLEGSLGIDSGSATLRTSLFQNGTWSPRSTLVETAGFNFTLRSPILDRTPISVFSINYNHGAERDLPNTPNTESLLFADIEGIPSSEWTHTTSPSIVGVGGAISPLFGGVSVQIGYRERNIETGRCD